jgi:hypothetical protein
MLNLCRRHLKGWAHRAKGAAYTKPLSWTFHSTLQ